MFSTLFIIALFQSFTVSIPIPPNHFIRSPESLPATHEFGLRTRTDIIRSCISTLFICTWVAIHPNIPPRGEGSVRSLWRRMTAMFWMLVVPELVLAWAFRQWVAARSVAKRFRDEGWTMAHGHFLVMGGFILVDGDREKVLDYKSFLDKGFAYQVSFPTITAAEIQDKSRGDFLSKAIAFLQSAWFIAQCIARGKQRLALTELELVTLALASLNGVMYFLWWDKPLGVKEPVKVYLIDQDPPKKVVVKRPEPASSSEAAPQSSLLQRFHEIVKKPHTSILPFLRHFRSSCGALFLSIPHRLSKSLSLIATFFDELFSEVPILLYPFYFIYLLFVFPILALGISLIQIVTTTEIEDDDATSVPTFYAPPLDSFGDPDTVFGDTDTVFFLTALPLVATIFGALHLIAWQFQFPSHIEQLLWRIGSFVITAVPAVPLVVEIALLILAIPPVIILIIAFFFFQVVRLTQFLEERHLTPFLKSLKERLRSLSARLPESVKRVLDIVMKTIVVIARKIEIAIAVISFLAFFPAVLIGTIIYGVSIVAIGAGIVAALAGLVPALVAALVGLVAIVAGVVVGLVGYMFARLLLLTEAFVLLREQPEAAFYEISWINFWPHI